MKALNTYCSLLLLISFYSYAQIDEYNYKRELIGVSAQWHKIILPDEVFSKVSSGLSDIRICGITPDNDTVEAPYLLRLTSEKASDLHVNFDLLNPSHNENGYYFTFEIPANNPVNRIDLEFKLENFDWDIKLEGSEDLKEWFTVIEDYRIISVKNDLTSYKFTSIIFPTSRYRFYRLLIPTRENPQLKSAGISEKKLTPGNYNIYKPEKTDLKNDKKNRQTRIDIDLKQPVPVSYIKIGVKETFDYYRDIIITYVEDSIKTEQGWKYNYRTLGSGILNSIEENEFKFSSTILQKLQIIINNRDNRPLTIDTIEIKGYILELIGRFTEPAEYFLIYGKPGGSKPEYDIARFSDKIPAELKTLELGNEEEIEREEASVTDPFFKNKIWLWVILIIIILLLGWSSVKMIKKK